MKYILAILLLTSTSSALADSEWFEIKQTEANKSGGKLEIKVGSFEISKAGHYKYRSALARLTESNNQISLIKLSVKDLDCAKKYGTIYMNELNGASITTASFIFNGGNIASWLAEMICSVNDGFI